MLKNLKIAKKILLGFLLSIFVTCAVGSMGIIGLSRISVADQSLYSQQTEPLQYIAKMIETLQKIRIDERNAMIYAGNSYKISGLESDLEACDSTFRENESKYLSALRSAEETKLIGEAKEEYEKNFLPAAKEVMKYASSGSMQQANSTMVGASATADKILAAYDRIFQNASSDALEKSRSNRDLFLTMTAVLIAVIATGVVVSAVLCAAIIRSIREPMKELEDVSGHFADGVLTARIGYESNNEIGAVAKSLNFAFARTNGVVREVSDILTSISKGDCSCAKVREYRGSFKPISNALNTILDELNRIFSDILKSADQVDGGSKQVSDGAQELAQGASEQAGSVEQLSASISDVSEKVKNNVERINTIAEGIHSASEEADRGGGAMRRLLGSMAEIQEASDEIGKINQSINDIAFQTNILSLTAAVEAARAGEAGKGFAVVADEIRSLAAKSADAAKQTSALIDNSARKVEEGKKTADGTAKLLSGIIAGIKDVNGLVESVREASNAQSASIGRITRGIGQVSGVIQTNSSAAEESAAASEELAAQADALKETVHGIRLRSSGGQPELLTEAAGDSR